MTRLERFSRHLRNTAPPPMVAPVSAKSHQSIMYAAAMSLRVWPEAMVRGKVDHDRTIAQQSVRRAAKRDGAS